MSEYYDDNYDEQIEALLADDYAEFERLAGLPLSNSYEINSDYDAWGYSGPYSDSLFAYLPYNMTSGCDVCATQADLPHLEQDIGDRYFGPRRPRLPAPEDDMGKFTREQLNEIARRQRLAAAYRTAPPRGSFGGGPIALD